MGKNMDAPAVSVIMAVYNGERHLAEAVDSILTQTFTDFEFIIVDDGSTDGTPGILRSYALEDKRITILTNTANKGRSFARNRAMERASSELIAVMDADDVSLPERIEKLVAFMRGHPEVTVCGGALSIYDSPDEIWRPPTEHEAIRANLLFESSINHAVSIYRKAQVSKYAGGYDISMPLAQDYDLWARLSMNPAVRFANLPEILYRYRCSGRNAEDLKFQQRKAKANLVRQKLLRHIGLSPSKEEFAAHLALSLWSKKLSRADLWACQKWLGKLYAAALAAEPAYDRKTLERTLKRRWLSLCANNIAASALGLVYFCSEFSDTFMGIKIAVKKFLKRRGGKTLCA